MKKLPFLLALALLLGSATVYFTGAKWTSAADNYSVTFKDGKLEGSFTGLKSEVNLDEADMSKSFINASIDATSINTGNGVRDEHAESEEGLNAEKFKEISFKSSKVEKADGKYVATGTLTMKGVEKPLTIPFTFDQEGKAAVLKGSFSVAPNEFGVTRGGTPEEVTITLAVPYSNN